MLESTKVCLRKYAIFSGRASRKEFADFTLVALSAVVITYFVVGEIASIALIAFLATPYLAVHWRRMHDAGYAGWHVGLALTVFSIGAFFAYLGGEALSQLAAGKFVPVDPNLAAAMAFGGLFVRIVGSVYGLWVLFILARRTMDGPNRFGPGPGQSYAAPIDETPRSKPADEPIAKTEVRSRLGVWTKKSAPPPESVYQPVEGRSLAEIVARQKVTAKA